MPGEAYGLCESFLFLYVFSASLLVEVPKGVPKRESADGNWYMASVLLIVFCHDMRSSPMSMKATWPVWWGVRVSCLMPAMRRGAMVPYGAGGAHAGRRRRLGARC